MQKQKHQILNLQRNTNRIRKQSLSLCRLKRHLKTPLKILKNTLKSNGKHILKYTNQFDSA